MRRNKKHKTEKDNRERSVYTMHHPITDQIIYIGITIDTEKRYEAHINDYHPERNSWKYFQLLRKQGLEPKMKVLAKITGLSKAQKIEKLLMEECTKAGIPLLNGDPWVTNEWPEGYIDSYFSRIDL